MDIEKLVEMACKEGEANRLRSGQVTLKYLRDILSMLPVDMACRYDTGHNFGLDPVRYVVEPEYISEKYPEWNRPAYDSASSKTAYPSAYRGYYSDCTFNASRDYPESTVGHVLDLINGAIGKTFDGYKGGLNRFGEGTPVWGGGTSHSRCGDSEMVVGVEVRDGVCVLLTGKEEW